MTAKPNPVLFIHGLWIHPSAWGSWIERFARAGYTASAIRYPDAISIIDELGSLTFDEVHRRTNALAHALSDDGVNEGDGVAIMCRNHRGFAGNERALADHVGEALLDAGLLSEKPSVGQRHVYLNPRRAGDIRRLIDEGVPPPELG